MPTFANLISQMPRLVANNKKCAFAKKPFFKSDSIYLLSNSRVLSDNRI